MIDDAEGNLVVLSERRPQARAAHRCDGCSRTIQPGEHYLTEATVCEGRFEIYKTCAHCQVVRDWLQRECGGFLYCGVGEDIAKHAQSGLYGFGVQRLAAGMRVMWARKRGTRKGGALWPIPSLPAGAGQRMDAEL